MLPTFPGRYYFLHAPKYSCYAWLICNYCKTRGRLFNKHHGPLTKRRGSEKKAYLVEMKAWLGSIVDICTSMCAYNMCYSGKLSYCWLTTGYSSSLSIREHVYVSSMAIYIALFVK